jgi:hypothetical protein
MLLIGGSIPPMANVLFFVLIFFVLIFPKIAFIQHLSVRLRLEFIGSRLFFKCVVFN